MAIRTFVHYAGFYMCVDVRRILYILAFGSFGGTLYLDKLLSQDVCKGGV